jgi:hypothetical protein
LNSVTVSSTGNYYPRIEVQDNAGAALVYASTDGVADRYQLDGQITVSATTMGDTKTMHVFIQTY